MNLLPVLVQLKAFPVDKESAKTVVVMLPHVQPPTAGRKAVVAFPHSLASISYLQIQGNRKQPSEFRQAFVKLAALLFHTLDHADDVPQELSHTVGAGPQS
jgi:hypothetical protein